jgi:cobalt/nickel transport system ATP-binding protein
LVIEGPNGAGKTTLLHLVVGLLRPAAGRIVAFGRERRQERDFHEVRARAGLLFQDADDQLFCPTVLEDVAFGPINLGRTPAQAREIAEATLVAVGLDGFGPRITHRLSGGEKRLATLACVLAMRPDALLLDEPTTGLDERAEAALTRLLLDLPQAMLIVSHDRAFRDRLATRRVKLRDGRLDDA